MEDMDKFIARASQLWREVCLRLEVRITAPYVLEIGNESALCIAFLPDFGGKNGMVIAAMNRGASGSNEHLKSLAKRKGLYWSFVNAPAFASGTIEDNVFTEALDDWGYYGPQEKCPQWFKGFKYGKALP